MATLDTPAVVAELYRTLLMQRSGSDRLIMGCRMFDTSRALIRASAGMQTGTDMKIHLFKRTYGRDFDNETVERIIRHWRNLDCTSPALSHPGYTG
ncbi:MAG: hypothetical protein U1F76_06180 [Candidatus Competibacteraceae bacterium]